MPLKSLAQLVRPTRRALPWRPPLAATVLAIVIVGWAVHRGSSGAALAPALRNASLFLAVGSAMALEDEAATVVAPSPISVAWRRVVRLALAVTTAAAGWAACLGLAWWAGGSLPLGDHSLEGLAIFTAVHGLAVAVGPTLGTPVLAGVVTVGPRVPAVAEQWERTIGRVGDATTQWLLILATSLLVVALFSRDPAGRRRALKRRGAARRPRKAVGPTHDQPA